MPSIDDLFNALNAIRARLDQLHADEQAVHQRLDALLAEQQRTSSIGVHLTKQNRTIICALEKVSRNTCELVTIADHQRRSAEESASSLRVAAHVLQTAHPAAALQLAREEHVSARLDECCPPEPAPPRCEYEPCRDPGAYREG
jgi:hypothetical protein